MRFFSCATVLIALIVLTLACGVPENRTEEAVQGTDDSGWQKTLAEFRSWELMPGTTEMMEARGWHTERATIRINKIARETIVAGADSLPDGAMVVKENFDGAGALVNIVTAHKQDGVWRWVQYLPGGTVDDGSQAPGRCIECHAMGPNDMLLSWKKPLPTP